MAHYDELDSIYEHMWSVHGDEFAELDRSLNPRSWEFLFDVARTAGLERPHLAVDVGCGRGIHTGELARRFRCRVLGIDRVVAHLRHAEEDAGSFHFVQGTIEALPVRTGEVDFVWCRDMLEHVCDLNTGLQECARVLRPGGTMLAYTIVATELMEPREAERLYAPLSIQPANMSQSRMEEAFVRAGFSIKSREEIGSELVEFYEERDGRASRELLRLARMRRSRERLISEWGARRYEVSHALYHWVAYHMIGKLSGIVYVLRKD